MLRRPKLIIVIAVVVVLIALLAGPGTSFFTDLLWYDDLGLRDLYLRQLSTQILLFAISAAVFALVLGTNVYLARRFSPLRPLAITNDFLFNLRRTVDPVLRWILAGVIVAGAVMFGAATFPRWASFLTYVNQVPFGTKDPVFHKDVGFYVFSLPIWKFAFGWLFAALIVTIVVVAAVYAYAGAIGPQSEGSYLAIQPRVHLSILLGAMLLLKAVGYKVNQWELLYSPRGVVRGASYTDVKAQLPAFQVLFWIAIISALLLFATFAVKRLVLPVIAVALMAVSALIIGGVYPRVIQQLRVAPNEIQKESPYIARNIEFTRRGFGLDRIKAQGYEAVDSLTNENLEANRATLANVRLWESGPLITSYKQIQELRPYYNFNSIAVDRYQVAGEDRQVLISAREVDPSQLRGSAKTWQNTHLVYTHGFGAVASQANEVTESGGPSLLVKNIPPVTRPDAKSLDVRQPRVYFGQLTRDFVITNTTVQELDSDGEQKSSRTIAPDRGVKMDSFLKRLAFSIRFGDAKFVLSSAIKADSRLLYDREVSLRVHKAAPFLRLDASPYLVVLDGRLVWVVDGYTTTSLYPYAEPLGDDTTIPRDTTYIRNSVKATVDAYSGKVTLYRVDMADPIAAAWAKAFPSLMRSNAEVPKALREHFRYPIDLYNAQLQQYALYHMTSPRDFYNKEDLWSVASRAGGENTDLSAQAPPNLSQYLNVRLPGDKSEEFVLFNSYTPAGKDNLVSFLAARSDPDTYGRLTSYRLPRQRQINGPQQVESLVNQEPSISGQITLLGQKGSEIIFGQIVIVPIADSLIYVQPLYLQATEVARPELKRVVVVFGNKAVMRPTFPEALQATFGFSPLGARDPGPRGPPPPPRGGAPPPRGAPPPAPPPPRPRPRKAGRPASTSSSLRRTRSTTTCRPPCATATSPSTGSSRRSSAACWTTSPGRRQRPRPPRPLPAEPIAPSLAPHHPAAGAA